MNVRGEKRKVMKEGRMKIVFLVVKRKLLKKGEGGVLMGIRMNGEYEDVGMERRVGVKLWKGGKGWSKGRERG